MQLMHHEDKMANTMCNELVYYAPYDVEAEVGKRDYTKNIP